MTGPGLAVVLGRGPLCYADADNCIWNRASLLV